MNLGKLVELASAPWVGTLLGLLGLLAAIYFYRKSRRVTRLVYQVDEITVVGGASAAFPEELEIIFAGSKVPRVTSSKVVLWNAGNVTFQGLDIVAGDPLRFQVSEGAAILRADITKLSREVTDVVVTPREDKTNIVNIAFDFLDPSDGVVVDVIHTDSKGEFRCWGTLRGVRDGPVSLGEVTWRRDEYLLKKITRRMAFNIFLLIMILVGLYFVAKGFVPRSEEDFKPLYDPRGPDWIVIGMGSMYLIAGFAGLWFRRRRYPASLLPTLVASDPPAETEPS